jgi:hypothetical protein
MEFSNKKHGENNQEGFLQKKKRYMSQPEIAGHNNSLVYTMSEQNPAYSLMVDRAGKPY